jgi:hypothetical protein
MPRVIQRAFWLNDTHTLSLSSQLESFSCVEIALLKRQIRLRRMGMGTKDDGNSPL